MGRIVVGVDGSPNARRALEWAAAEATLRQAELEVVCAFQPLGGWLGVGEAMGGTTAVPPPPETLAEAARCTAADEVAAVCAGREGVSLHAEEGDPAHVLEARSAGAELLVVGASGHGDLAGLVLGSTSLHCVHHARCPVAVVRGVTGAPG